MNLTQEQIKNLSLNLSKFSIDTEKLNNEIKDNINYISILDELDTTWIEPTYSLIAEKAKLREDSIWEDKISPSELLDCSNQKVIWGQIAVSNIMK